MKTVANRMGRALLCLGAVLLAGCATDPALSTRPPGAEYESARNEYLTDAAFDCRHPILSRRFASQLKSPVGVQPCQGAVPFNVVSRQTGSRVAWVDPGTVRSIHLLFAGQGKAVMSRFGHVSLRLVVCPGVTSDEKACHENLTEHLVVGFGAHVNDLEIDVVKALRGGYSASLFAAPFMDAYRDYAIDEFREVYSLPLVLAAGRRERMVRELAEIHWSHAEKYDFFSSNCASLLQRALRVIWPESLGSPAMASDFIRPDRFFAAMRASQLGEGALLSDLQQAERDGFYFPSTEPFYARAVTLMQRSMAEPAFDDIDSYLEVPPPRRRHNIESDPPYARALARDRHLMGAQIMMEELAMQRGERKLLATAAKFFHELAGQDSETLRRHFSEPQRVAFERCLVDALALVTRPIVRTHGIPRGEEVPPAMALPPICSSSEGRQALLEALEVNGRHSPGHWKQLTAVARYWADSVSNVAFLRH